MQTIHYRKVKFGIKKSGRMLFFTPEFFKQCHLSMSLIFIFEKMASLSKNQIYFEN